MALFNFVNRQRTKSSDSDLMHNQILKRKNTGHEHDAGPTRVLHDDAAYPEQHTINSQNESAKGPHAIPQILHGSYHPAFRPVIHSQFVRPLSSSFVTSSEASPIIVKTDQPIPEAKSSKDRELKFQKLFGANKDFPPGKIELFNRIQSQVPPVIFKPVLSVTDRTEEEELEYRFNDSLTRMFQTRITIMQSLYAHSDHEIPRVARHEPFSYTSLIKAEQEAQNLFADFSLLRRRLDNIKGLHHIKHVMRAFEIDLDFLIN
jgi:hypothetical protein